MTGQILSAKLISDAVGVTVQAVIQRMWRLGIAPTKLPSSKASCWTIDQLPPDWREIVGEVYQIPYSLPKPRVALDVWVEVDRVALMLGERAEMVEAHLVTSGVDDRGCEFWLLDPRFPQAWQRIICEALGLEWRRDVIDTVLRKAMVS
jgi:hypothetical protein